MRHCLELCCHNSFRNLEIQNRQCSTVPDHDKHSEGDSCLFRIPKCLNKEFGDYDSLDGPVPPEIQKTCPNKPKINRSFGKSEKWGELSRAAHLNFGPGPSCQKSVSVSTLVPDLLHILVGDAAVRGPQRETTPGNVHRMNSSQ